MGKGRAPCCDKSKVKKGPWSREEDIRLVTFINKYGHQNWRSLPKQAGLLRCGKSCRLRWINYLRPDVKRGNFTPQEEETIIKLHQSFGNKWSKIASHLPGRTDNEIKNVWNTHLKKRLHGEAKLFDGSCANNSPSCSSSTSVLSHSDSANIEGEFKNVNANNMITEKQDATKSCSSASTLSNLSQVEISSDPYVNGTDVDDWIFNPEPNNLELRSKVHDDGVIEIPLECDADFWDILDIMDPLPPISESKQHDTSQSVCQVLSEFEHQKWF